MKILKINKGNAIFQQILSIKNNRHKRHVLKKFFVEGVQNIKDAIKYNWQVDSLIFTSFEKLSKWAKNIVENNSYNNYEISSDLMEILSDKTNKSEILAIFKFKEYNFYINDPNPIILFLDRPSKKANLGNIIRSADAFKVSHIVYSGHCVDIFDHEVISASMGSIFKVPFTYLDSNIELNNMINNLKIKYKDLKIVATSLQAKKNIQEENLTGPIMLLMGNEREGLGKNYYQIANYILKIVIINNIDSLNLASATSIFLYEISRQRKGF